MPSVIDLSEAFGKQQTASCMGLELQLFAHNTQKEEPLGRVSQVVLHWTAGGYAQVWDSYHFNIAFDARIPRACVAKTLKLTQKGQHVWKRNTGSVGITLCAMANPKVPVHKVQEQAVAELCAELLRHYKLTLAQLTDHAHWAELDGYFPERWDIGSHMAVIRQLTKVHLARLTTGEAKPIYTHLFG